MARLSEVFAASFSAAFDLPDLGDQSDPLPLDVLQTKPDHPIVQTIMYIYSLEPPFYRALNRACRDKDLSRLDVLGPFAAALGEIVRRQDAKRADKKTENFTVYRGLSLPQSDILGFAWILESMEEEKQRLLVEDPG